MQRKEWKTRICRLHILLWLSNIILNEKEKNNPRPHFSAVLHPIPNSAIWWLTFIVLLLSSKCCSHLSISSLEYLKIVLHVYMCVCIYFPLSLNSTLFLPESCENLCRWIFSSEHFSQRCVMSCCWSLHVCIASYHLILVTLYKLCCCGIKLG